MIYVKILADKFSINSAGYLSYILLYNFIYVMPLIFIVSLFGWTFRAKQISQRQIEIIKFFGGLIMILLGILLLVNPVLLGVGV
jgi:cytochrome c biogenesis protein CcdA